MRRATTYSLIAAGVLASGVIAYGVTTGNNPLKMIRRAW
jgi:hypothetical protein